MPKIDATPFTGPFPPASPPAGMGVFQLPTGSYLTRAALAFRGGRWTDQRDFASTAVLVRHPGGDVLIDAGFGANAAQHIRTLPAFRRSPHQLGATARQQLDDAGYDHRRLLGAVLTHSHWDHVSGLDSLDVPVWLAPGERPYAEGAKDDRVFSLVTRRHTIREYAFDGPAHLGFRSSHDVHGDGSVVIVPAAGHTPGSVVVFVTLPSAQRFAFIGDLTWQLDGITRRVDRPLLLRALADSDSSAVREDLSRVIALADRVHLVPAHDARAYQGIPRLTAETPAAT
ncbi:glyoxylase-like metal-dependent hydrolase (beta-lactamase superfamily II) [Catenuloplanes nepalensis]|uniref:Glyoxylase-like metal-dependent hydrolase (Beta-lactamase superfamily II) n=1 Tax=Catenuloplanes nepalensis TaxID=587533 RepID=A0ABT9MNX8_9ACTN|nr:MBL fold metallo-hydrolase [Catenuloplanes nepalensis]MDP9793148.1 glyoxylase-like metal-dependent hydrolase (beta-lactamase superfamily II) [Catenuloplanes nepalensis]